MELLVVLLADHNGVLGVIGQDHVHDLILSIDVAPLGQVWEEAAKLLEFF